MFELHFVVIIFLRFLGEFCFAVVSTFNTKIYLRRTHINVFFANLPSCFFLKLLKNDYTLERLSAPLDKYSLLVASRIEVCG